jgi:hypothetical protein
MILKVLSAEPKTDQNGNLQLTSNGAKKYRTTLQNPQAPGTPLVATAYGDWITEIIGQEADLTTDLKPGFAGGPAYTVVNRVKPAETVANKQIEANPPGLITQYNTDRQDSIERQCALKAAVETMQRVVSLEDENDLARNVEYTLKIAAVYRAWIAADDKEDLLAKLKELR